MPTLASMQCACVCIAALRDATANAAIWPKHYSAAIAVRYELFSQLLQPNMFSCNAMLGACQKTLH